MDYAAADPADARTADALGSLAAKGVAPWLDGVHRGLIASGRLGGLVRQGLRGATMDPAAPDGLASHPAYAEQLSRLAARCTSAESAVWALAAQDLVRAATNSPW